MAKGAYAKLAECRYKLTYTPFGIAFAFLNTESKKTNY